VHAHRGMSSVDRGRLSGTENGHEHNPRVLVFGSFWAPDDEAMEQLDRLPCTVVRCQDLHVLLEAMVHRAPAAVVFELRKERPQDLGALHLIRRALPRVPLIVVADEDSLELRRRVQVLQPTYYAVRPLDRAEIAEALADTLQHAGSLH